MRVQDLVERLVGSLILQDFLHFVQSAVLELLADDRLCSFQLVLALKLRFGFFLFKWHVRRRCNVRII